MASRFPPILRGTHKGMFETVHLPNENFGEIDPFFIAEHFHQLGSRWNIYDPDGIPHQIEFIRSILNPLITFGWPRIRNYYTWTGNKALTFFYYGEDSFLMIINENRRNVSRASFPPFHSLSTNFGDYRSFEMVMTDSNINSSKLVLSEDLGAFLYLSEYPRIKLLGPLSHIITCKLELLSEKGPTIQFGKGWAKICRLNNIVEGNCLQFTNDGFMHYNVLIVEII